MEFKRALRSDLGRDFCAFANATGGVILLGVDDDGAVRGVEGHNRLKSQVQSVARSADPPIGVEVESMGEVLAVRVSAQRRRPYSFGGKFFIREGATSQQMSRDEIREFFFTTGAIRFDEAPCRRFALDEDIDEDNWELFRERAKIPNHLEPAAALANLNLLTGDGRMTNAGAWLLAKRITKFSLSAEVVCALFRGAHKTHIIDRVGSDGDVCTMIDDAMAWIESKINVNYIITGTLRRKERPELPLDAIREAVVNAVAHRDYRSTASVHIYLFHDRLEVVSPGGLPPGMTVQELGVRSEPRNRLLFRVLHRMDAVEHIGTGVRRIRDLCREWDVDAPIFDISDHWVTVTFPRPPVSRQGARRARRDQTGRLPSTKSAPSRHQVAILHKSLSPQPITALMAVMRRKDRTKFRNQVVRPLLEAGWIAMTVPDKPTSRNQRYRTTAAGRATLAGAGEGGRYPMAETSDPGELPMVREYPVVIEKGPNNYAACVPDLPGCVATGRTRDDVALNIRNAIALHLGGIRADGGDGDQ